MENLLCDESWLSGSQTPEFSGIIRRSCWRDNAVAAAEAISLDLGRELCFTPRDKYVEILVSRDLIDARYRAVQWIIESRTRLNLSFGTVFSAVNCLDRFISISSCNDWKYWMVELLSVACLSIASKFSQVSYLTLQEIQMEGLDHTFRNSTVLQMELILLKALDWRVGTITSYSFSQMILHEIGLSADESITARVTDYLLEDLSDFKIQEYPPSVVGVSAVWIVLQDLGLFPYSPAVGESLERTMNLLGEERKEKVARCTAVMKSRQTEQLSRRTTASSGLESPVTVLLRDQQTDNGVIASDGHIVDLSMFQILGSEDGSKKKRDRECYEEKMV